MKQGILLVNLGTPGSLELKAVRRYLTDFLSDRRVIELNWLARKLLLYAYILPFRTQRSAKAYAKIWTEQGSPLLVNMQALTKKLQETVKDTYQVEFAFTYGQPSLQRVLSTFSTPHITILLLYPQYASASTGAGLEKIFKIFSHQTLIPSLSIIHSFYQHPAFIKAQAACIAPYLSQHEFVLFSYHGLPQRQLQPFGCIDSDCTSICPLEHKPFCYRSQCYTTSQRLAEALQLSPRHFTTTFQSRLGRTPWIKPYLEETLLDLRQQGIKTLLVTAPSFTTDCLETLEEIGIRAQQQWLQLGGERLTLAPALNDSPEWIQAIIEICKLNGTTQVTGSQTCSRIEVPES